MKLLPCSPNMCMNPSITKAARAMYPVPSRIAIARKSSRIFGRKTRTPPTPPMIPSVSMRRRKSACPAGQMALIVSLSHSKNAASQSIGYCPSEKVNMNTRYIISRKIGTPRNRFVT